MNYEKKDEYLVHTSEYFESFLLLNNENFEEYNQVNDKMRRSFNDSVILKYNN